METTHDTGGKVAWWMRMVLAIMIVVVIGIFIGESNTFHLVKVLPVEIMRSLRMYQTNYHAFKGFCFDNWLLISIASFFIIVGSVLFLRAAISLWHNKVLAKISGSYEKPLSYQFDLHRYAPHGFINDAYVSKKGHFVGLTPDKKPVYLSQRDLSTHLHIMGHTGSGKTTSVLLPLMFQDMLSGKSVIFMDAKGSAENVQSFLTMADDAKRYHDSYIFSLADPKHSHTYNPVYYRDGDDIDAISERLFALFPLENEYYKGQAKLYFYNVMRLFAGTNFIWNIQDLKLCMSNQDCFDYIEEHSHNKAARYELTTQLEKLGKRAHETFTGLYNALADFEHPLLLSYKPDIILEDLMNDRKLLYINLPANRYELLAPNIGKLMLAHIKTIGAYRQLHRTQFDQTPCSISIDELNRFAFDALVPSLAMLRDANMQFRLSHQSVGDLEQVSDVFARQVHDNTRTKIFLYENDPQHLETIARSYGTTTTYKKTVRYSLGPLLTHLNTGEVSNREVEEFILHPNQLKSLKPYGQAVILKPEGVIKVNVAPLQIDTKTELGIPNHKKRKIQREPVNLYERFVEKI